MSRGDLRRYLVTYDVSDDKRRTELYTALFGFGDWAQYSVFFCELTRTELARLRREARTIIDHREDQIIILDLGRAAHPLENCLDVLGRGYQPQVRSRIV